MLRGHLPPSGHSDHWKHELVQSFQGITSRKVSQSQTEKAEQCIKDGGINERYQLIDVEKILSRNLVMKHTGMACITCTCDSSFDLYSCH